jgi:hypothetical protein
MIKRFTFGFIAVALLTSQASAQSVTPITNDDFSKETENPVTRQITLPLKYEADFLYGADKLQRIRFKSISSDAIPAK